MLIADDLIKKLKRFQNFVYMYSQQLIKLFIFCWNIANERSANVWLDMMLSVQ